MQRVEVHKGTRAWVHPLAIAAVCMDGGMLSTRASHAASPLLTNDQWFNGPLLRLWMSASLRNLWEQYASNVDFNVQDYPSNFDPYCRHPCPMLDPEECPYPSDLVSRLLAAGSALQSPATLHSCRHRASNHGPTYFGCSDLCRQEQCQGPAQRWWSFLCCVWSRRAEWCHGH